MIFILSSPDYAFYSVNICFFQNRIFFYRKRFVIELINFAFYEFILQHAEYRLLSEILDVTLCMN